MSEFYPSLDNLDVGTTVCRCTNCEWSGGVHDCEIIKDAELRLCPGETVPAGECPKCGALAYIEEAAKDAGRPIGADALDALRVAEDALCAALPHADRIRDLLMPALEQVRAARKNGAVA